MLMEKIASRSIMSLKDGMLDNWHSIPLKWPIAMLIEHREKLMSLELRHGIDGYEVLEIMRNTWNVAEYLLQPSVQPQPQ